MPGFLQSPLLFGSGTGAALNESKGTLMSEISIEHNMTPVKLDRLAVDRWPIWSKEVSTFPWTYDQSESCYILDGEAVVTPDGGEPVTISAGDYVVFPAGMSCTWDIKEDIRKHYMFK
jgi:hypothetical protein